MAHGDFADFWSIKLSYKHRIILTEHLKGDVALIRKEKTNHDIS